MIKHLVMWTLKPEAEGATAAENAVKMKTMLEALVGVIPGLRHLEVSADIVEASPACQVVLYSELDDEAALAAYQPHPAHQACVAFIRTVVASRSVLDYEI
ncbi:MAG: Dabb family protein [Desulfovibrionaceae bacterium]